MEGLKIEPIGIQGWKVGSGKKWKEKSSKAGFFFIYSVSSLKVVSGFPITLRKLLSD